MHLYRLTVFFWMPWEHMSLYKSLIIIQLPIDSQNCTQWIQQHKQQMHVTHILSKQSALIACSIILPFLWTLLAMQEHSNLILCVVILSFPVVTTFKLHFCNNIYCASHGLFILLCVCFRMTIRYRVRNPTWYKERRGGEGVLKRWIVDSC